MALAETLTDIANLALASIGEKVIQNIDDESAIARDINRVLFESIRQTQLEILWEELTEIIQPSQVTDRYPGNDSLYQYRLPNNFLDVVHLKSGSDWFLSGGKLITDDPEPVLTYKRYSQEVSEWSGYLVELIYRRVAANVAMPLTQNGQVASMAMDAYRQAQVQNLTRSSNRSRKGRFRDNFFGNLRSRRVNSNSWPFGYGQKAGR
jgi:hypothetical protein